MPEPALMRYRKGARVHFGLREANGLHRLAGDPFDRCHRTGEIDPLSEVRPLFPVQPRQILAVGRNYQSHLKGRTAPSRPEIFYKPFAALQHPGAPIVIPPEAENVHFEGELVLVIGRRTRSVSPAEAEASIYGITCGNDVSEREWQRGRDRDLQWWRAKGADTFAPVGPVVVRDLDHRDLRLQTRLNGRVRQEQTTGDLLFDCPTVISYISRYLTLFPGDLVFTGTPGMTDRLSPGDVVEVEIEGVGVLRNPVESC